VAGHRRTQALGIFAGVCIALLVAAASREHDRVPGLSDPAAGSVTFDRLRAADGDPRNWLTYSGQYSGQRFSRLGSINQSTVRNLQIRWIHQLRTVDAVEATPLVVDGVMYVTRGNDVIALDAATGRLYWTYSHPLPAKLPLCCGRQNRGLAILDGRLFMATLDAKLIALDAATGTRLWTAVIADPNQGYSSTGAPLVVKDKVITGIAGGEFGIRGFIDAYDAASGARAWRFYTVPGPDEAGHDTWTGDSWQTGGAPTWMTGSYDPALNLLYWGVGNPGPDWNGSQRGGDNLYSDSVLALDADRGTLRWHFQFTPHDEHDWDATQVPVLVDAIRGGRAQKLLYMANRNGFFYVLDRETGAFQLARPFARQTWADGIDEQGRAILKPNIAPTAHGAFVAPSANGAANWWPPAYSPRTGLFYVMAYDGGSVFVSGESAHVPSEMFLGGIVGEEDPAPDGVSAVRAIDPATGDKRWEFPVKAKSMSGLLASAGGLVFGGTVDGYMFALDASSGAELWHRSVGGAVVAAPMTYAVNDTQYVAIAAGNTIVAFSLN
jgi:alcohol dehydrogenase (cytochrome c)